MGMIRERLHNINRMCERVCASKVYKYEDDAKAAVMDDPSKLVNCTPELADKEEVVEIAVKGDGLMLHWASLRLQDVDRIVEIAVKQNGKALKYASKRLRNNPELKALAKEQIAAAKAKKKSEKKAEVDTLSC